MLIIKKYYKSLAGAAVIIILSLMPPSGVQHLKVFQIPYFDKIVHLILYFLWGLLLISESTHQTEPKPAFNKRLFVAAAISVSFGAIIEIIQLLFVPSRSANLFDFVANVVGFALAAWSFKGINRFAMSCLSYFKALYRLF